jgi:hypothetical protein
MNVRFRFIVLSLLVAALGACASMDETAGIGPQGDVRIVQNGEYVAAVEHMAKQRGVRVMWVNPPDKRVEQPDD